jgi:hypothetical protein
VVQKYTDQMRAIVAAEGWPPRSVDVVGTKHTCQVCGLTYGKVWLKKACAASSMPEGGCDASHVSACFDLHPP